MQHLQHDTKMSRTLFSTQPEVRYADYHERALLNHIILASQEIPTTAAFAVWCPWAAGCSTNIKGSSSRSLAASGPPWRVIHSTPTDSITNRATRTLGELVRAFHCRLEIRRREAGSEHRSAYRSVGYPEGHAADVQEVHSGAASPVLGGAGFTVKVNGAAFKTAAPADAYVEIARTWKAGDTVELVLPKIAPQGAVARTIPIASP